ncbi:sister chromatid cohesion protein PDS5 homolog A-B-like isoform X1 [Biomphalaria glabrata]|uniref:Sister chromatid cohesion protein PDS5 homolog A-B-like isoform X1 n=1 Tax=Biomphalaria glabrata TaxID=6526 RepID=A0A9W3B498_BIOGL|nr:sister chromatid cohesion protein PDS5 homolog A-B-like isoform X1 [Biomphalaria glabrata]
MAKSVQHSKIVYPPGCKELTEDVGKDELIRRLKILARAFQDMGQDDNDSYAPLALLLATDTYMEHSNKDVRLLTACCIADVFRIFAPEAPYKELDQLKEIFMFFIQQLRGLEDPDAPSFKRYFYLLENLSWVKSFNICIELEDNQEIFCALFKLFFSIINEKHTSKVKTFMLDIMAPLITEADFMSPELLETILVNMVDPNKTQKKMAFAMAKDLIKRTSTTIEPYIQTFFNNMLMLGKQAENDIGNHLYDLIYELNQVSPSILLAVIPQLEFKLKSNEETERKSVTKLLAKMFSEKDSDLAVQNRALWVCFLGRFNDISVSIRVACIQQTQHFILNHPELVKDILEQIKVRQHDPEESVRMDVVNSLLAVAKKDLKAMTSDMLQFVKERTLDKKFKIRRDALWGLGTMYKQAIIDKEVPDPELVSRLEFVKNKVFHHYYQNTPDDRLLVERMLNIHLVPYQKPVNERMAILLNLYSTLDEHAVRAFSEMLKCRNNVRQLVLQLVEAHDKANEASPPPVLPKLNQLARTMSDLLRPQECLKKFNLLLKDDARLRLLMKTLVGSSCTCKKAEEIVKEILKKIGCTSGTPNILYQLVKTLLERVAPVMVDSLAIDHLVLAVSERVAGVEDDKDPIDGGDQKGVQLLLTLSQYFPFYFKSVEIFENFLTFVKHDDDIVSDLAIQIITNTGSQLHIDHPDVYSSLVPLLTNIAKFGSPRQAKHALRCINTICINKEQAVTSIFESIQGALNPDNANYLTAIVSLGHIAQLFPKLFPSEIKSIVSKVIVKDLLMKDRTQGLATEDSWCSDHQVSDETKAKVQAMKLLVRWLLGVKSNTSNSGTSTLRLLYTVIIHDGDLMENGLTNKPELARLRLQAGCCMLKLAEEPCYAEIIVKEQFQALALMLNDVCYQVRLRFANRLHKGLISLKLPLEYMSILCLGANDPIKERRQQLKQFLSQNISKRRDYIKQNPSARGRMFYLLPDYVIPYTIHLLAHDPDFKSYEDVESLKSLKECLWFMMDPLTHKHEDYNYAFLRRMIENIKQTKDAQCPDDEGANKKLYAVCDIALGLMHAKTGTITLKEITQDPILPSKLFTAPDKNYSNLQSYLPKDFPFESKRRVGGSVNYTGEVKKSSSSEQTTTEIVVLSHAPVVNPLPRVPPQDRGPFMRKRKATEKEKQSVGEGFDSDSQSSKVSETDEPVKAKLVKPKMSAAVKVPVTVKVPGKRGRPKKIRDDDPPPKEPKPELKGSESPPAAKKAKPSAVKAGTKQTKIEDFAGGKGKNSQNGNTPVHKAKAQTPSNKDVKKKAQLPASPLLKVVTPPAPGRGRKRKSEQESVGSGKKDDRPSPAVVKRLKPPTLREDFSRNPSLRSTRPSPVHIQSGRKRSPPSSPTATGSSLSPSKISKVSRGVLRTSSDSGSERSCSPSALTPPAKRGPMTRPEPIQLNVRNTKSRVANGTSDGEDTPETEVSQSSSVTPNKPASNASSLLDEEEDTLNVKRKTRTRQMKS